jgi:hypothetical protein
MAIAPEPYRSACLAVLDRTILYCRAAGWSNALSAEHVADLMDAVHNIPWFIQNWERCDVALLRAMLYEYEQKWLGTEGMALGQIFDEVAGRS